MPRFYERFDLETPMWGEGQLGFGQGQSFLGPWMCCLLMRPVVIVGRCLGHLQAATNMVLLGDPQQLKQPQQGSHPEGSDLSALEYLLGEHQTIPRDRGLFIDKTRRMHPSICAFISELFYENRLSSRRDLDRQVLEGPSPFCRGRNVVRTRRP